MKKIRRLYLYAVSFISMEVLLWGLIGLARSIFSDTVGGGVDALAQALALVLVGALVFGFHWWMAQRGAVETAEERTSAIRAFFLYAAIFVLLVPIVQNGLAILNRLLLNLFDVPISRAMLGQSQSWSDNLIAALMNALIAAYFMNILRGDWGEAEKKNALLLHRRIYRYLWVLYALGMSIIGVQQIFRYLFTLLAQSATYISRYAWFANGLAMTLIGVPLWVWTWKTVQASLAEPAERTSLFRLGVLYFLSLAGVIFVLATAGVIVNALLLLLLGEINTFRDLMQEIAEPLSVMISFGVVWAYYGGWLQKDIAAVSIAPRRAGMRRIYYYILSLIGLAAAFVGLASLLSFIIDTAFASSLWTGNLKTRLASSLATLLVGLPLWLYAWRPMQAEAFADDEAGEHARRSGIRRVYLYLALFAGVVGGMVAAVRLASLLFKAMLGAPPSGFAGDLLIALQMLILFGGVLVYHWKTLQKDGTQRITLLEEKHAQFNVLCLASSDDPLALQLASAMEEECPQINLLVQPQPEQDTDIHALILPEDAALNPTEKLKAWLSQFDGNKFIIPRETSDWFWVREPDDVAKSLRQLAEGEEIQDTKKAPGWMIAVYILAGLMSLEILFFLVVITIDSLGI